jgi:hypothetical protein
MRSVADAPARKGAPQKVLPQKGFSEAPPFLISQSFYFNLLLRFANRRYRKGAKRNLTT